MEIRTDRIFFAMNRRQRQTTAMTSNGSTVQKAALDQNSTMRRCSLPRGRENDLPARVTLAIARLPASHFSPARTASIGVPATALPRFPVPSAGERPAECGVVVVVVAFLQQSNADAVPCSFFSGRRESGIEPQVKSRKRSFLVQYSTVLYLMYS